jgi:hypothetical protein
VQLCLRYFLAQVNRNTITETEHIPNGMAVGHNPTFCRTAKYSAILASLVQYFAGRVELWHGWHCFACSGSDLTHRVHISCDVS